MLKYSFFIFAVFFSTQLSGLSQQTKYEGNVGKARAEFMLTWEPDGTVNGSYFYPDLRPTRYTLRGHNKVQGILELSEYTGAELTARISLKKSTQDGIIIWSGTMKNLDGSSFAVRFSRKSTQASPPTKEIHLTIKSNHDLDTAPGYWNGDEYIENVDFPAKFISSSTAQDGTTIATFQLLPADDSDEFENIPAKFRIIPNPAQITVSSKKLSKEIAENVEGISIAPLGRYQGKACMLCLSSSVNATEARRLESGKIQITAFNTKTRASYTVALDEFTAAGTGIAAEWKVEEPDGDLQKNRQAPASKWKGNPYLFFGDGGATVFLYSKGWHLEGNGAGPGGTDYSYLETNSARGEFD
jgi:hypothetical protein